MKKARGITQEEINERRKVEEAHGKEMQERRRVHFETPQFPTSLLSDLFFKGSSNYVCPECRKTNRISTVDVFGSETLLDLFCLMNGVYCKICGSSSLLNDQNRARVALQEVLHQNAFNNVYQLLGASQHIGTVSLRPNQLNEIDLTEIGVSEDSTIVDIHYTPSGSYLPLEFHGNNPRYKQKYDSAIVYVWPAGLFEEGDGTASAVNIVVTSLRRGSDGIQRAMLNCVDSFIDGDQSGLLLNANVTLELSTAKICFKELRKSRKDSEVEDFLKTATYSYQIKFILELISNANNTVHLAPEVLAGMDLIRKRRNHIAHRGRLETKDGSELVLSDVERCETLSLVLIATAILRHIERTI